MVHSIGRQRSDALKVTVSLCLTYSLLFFFIAAYIRKRSRSWKLDDSIAVVAMLLSLGQYASQYIALHFGQGHFTATLLANGSLNSLNATNRAGVILFFLTLYTSKLSAIALYNRFAPLKRHKHLIVATLALFVLFCFISLMVLNVSCALTGPLYWTIVRHSDKCSDQFARWVATTALDFASEIIILSLPIDMVWSLQMSVKSKLMVLARFWSRIPVLILAIGRFIYIHSLLDTVDASGASNKMTILQEVEMAASLCATIVLTLRPLASEFNTEFGGGRGAFAAYGYSNSRSNNTMNSRGSVFANTGSKFANRFGLSSRKDSVVPSLLPDRKDSACVPLSNLQPQGSNNSNDRPTAQTTANTITTTTTISITRQNDSPNHTDSARRKTSRHNKPAYEPRETTQALSAADPLHTSKSDNDVNDNRHNSSTIDDDDDAKSVSTEYIL